jgi:RHS repeat-associated protein
MTASVNKTTTFRYNLDGKLVELVVDNGAGGMQVTRWEYGVRKGESGVASNELLRAKVYPDSDDEGNPLGDGMDGVYDGVYDRVEYRYDVLGELVGMKDQNQTEHEYEYDKLGRLKADRVTAHVTGVIDDAVLAIGRSYDVRGQLEKVTSYEDAGMTAVVNEVQYAYNGFGQVVFDYQAHGGAVNTGTTPKVGYEYADGTGNTIRAKVLVYPNTRRLHATYGAGGSIDDLLDRVQELHEDIDTGTVLARYTKRGVNSTVVVEYPEPAVEMTYIKQGSEPDGDAGDQYTGLDRFNRIEDIRWLKRSGGTSTDVERIQYGFDRAGNRRWRKNLVAPAGFDEAYEYDGLYQLGDMRRGSLNVNRSTVGGVPVWKETWSYDRAGNWKEYVTRVGGNAPMIQTRDHNKANEITFINEANTPVGYDGAGNMTVMPKVGAPGTAQQNTWDAWNRLVKVKEGATTVGKYAYDGLTRRVWKETSEGGSLVKRHGYFTSQWQLIEERTGTSATADRQFVCGTRYIDDLILRDCATYTPARLYALHDQWHVTAVIDDTGAPEERYIYSAFGVSTVLTGTFGDQSESLYGWETRYGAYRFDLETALYCVRHRYLHPALGRWLSRDPLTEVGFEVVRNLEFYSYGSNSPIDRVDIYGLAEKGLPRHPCPDLQKRIAELKIKTLNKDGKHEVKCAIQIIVGHHAPNHPRSTVLGWLKREKETVFGWGIAVGFVSCYPKDAYYAGAEGLGQDAMLPETGESPDDIMWIIAKHYPGMIARMEANARERAKKLCEKNCCEEINIYLFCAEDIIKILSTVGNLECCIPKRKPFKCPRKAR